MCVWPFFTPEAGGLRTACAFVLCPVNGRSEFTPTAAGVLATVRQTTSSVQPWVMFHPFHSYHECGPEPCPHPIHWQLCLQYEFLLAVDPICQFRSPLLTWPDVYIACVSVIAGTIC